MVTMKRSTVDRFGNIKIVGSEMEGPDVSLDMCYKTRLITALDPDPTRQMLPARSNHSRYNSSIKPHALD